MLIKLKLTQKYSFKLLAQYQIDSNHIENLSKDLII